MPNHLHLFIRLLPCKDQAPINLIHVVHQLQRFLKEAYQTITGDTTCAAPIQSQWHDAIAFDKAAVQRLKAYIKTIRNAPSNVTRATFAPIKRAMQKMAPSGAIMATAPSLRRPPSSRLNARAKSSLKPHSGSDGKPSPAISLLVAPELEPL